MVQSGHTEHQNALRLISGRKQVDTARVDWAVTGKNRASNISRFPLSVFVDALRSAYRQRVPVGSAGRDLGKPRVSGRDSDRHANPLSSCCCYLLSRLLILLFPLPAWVCCMYSQISISGNFESFPIIPLAETDIKRKLSLSASLWMFTPFGN
jgi:hypothetical protein